MSGPSGAQGPTGPTGLLGTSNIHSANFDQDGVTQNSTVTATATCPGSGILLGGGGQITTSGTATSADQAVLIQSFPSGVASWTATAKATTTWAVGAHLIVTAYVICSQ